MDKETLKVICHHCKYEWHTRSTRLYTCCPNCLFKVKIREFKKQEIKEEEQEDAEVTRYDY